MNAERKRQKRHEKRVMKLAKKRQKEERKAARASGVKRSFSSRGAGTDAGTAKSGRKSAQDKKRFARIFVTALAAFMVVLIPASFAVSKFLNTSPFQGRLNLGQGEEVQFEVLVDPESPFFEEFSDSERINILLMGVNPPLTDVLMLGSFDPKTRHVDIISIPRDTYYYRPGYAETDYAQFKINAAYRGDPVNTAKAVSDVLCGIPINYYAVVEYDDIRKIVDEMGGVPMYLEKDMDYDDEWDNPPLHIHLKAGQQTLSGDDSVKFLRFRKGYAEGDIGRIKAQQVWMKNAMSQAINYGILKVADVAFKEIDSNLTYGALLSLGTKALGIEAENITTYTMPNTPQPEPPWYVYPKQSEIEDMLREIYSIQPETTTDGAISGGAIEGGDTAQ